jgi:hypothetical protein
VPTAAAAFAAAELTVQTGTLLTAVGGGTHITLRAERVGTRYVASFFLDFPLANTGVSVLHLGKAGPGRPPLYQFMAGAATNDGGGAQAEDTWFAPLNLSLPAESYFGGSTRAIESRIVSSGVDGYNPKARYEDAAVRGYCKRTTTRTETTTSSSTGTTHTNTTRTTGTATETTTSTRTTTTATSTATSVSTATWATATTATTTTAIDLPKNVSENFTTTDAPGLVDAASRKRKRSGLWWVVLVAVLAILVVLFLVVKKRRAVAKQDDEATAEAAVDSSVTTEVGVWSQAQESEYDHLAARLHEKSRAADLLVVNEMYSTGDDDGDDALADELPPTLPPKHTSDGDVPIEGVGESRYATGGSGGGGGTPLYDQTTNFDTNENGLYDNAIAGGVPDGDDDQNMYDAATGADIYDTAAAGSAPIEGDGENMYDAAAADSIYDTAAAGGVPIEDNDENMYDEAGAGMVLNNDGGGDDGELNTNDVAGTGSESGAVYDGVELDDLYDGLSVIVPDVHVGDDGADQDTDDVPKQSSSRPSIYATAEVFDPQDDPRQTEKRGARVIDGDANVIDLFGKRFDVDSDGTLTRAEFMAGLERKPTIKAAVATVGFDVEALFAGLDRDGNGKFSVNEFLRGMEPVLVAERESRLGAAQLPLLNLAKDVDKDEDGDLSF